MKKILKMKNNILLFIISLTLFTSCKDDKPNEVTTESVRNQVKVSLSAIVKADDDFQLFFKEEDVADTPYEESNSVWAKIKGSEQPQNIEFVFPDNILPNYFRLDLGVNNKQQQVTITSIKVEYIDKKIEMNSSQIIEQYFIPNNCIDIKDKNIGLFNLIKGDNNSHDPFIISGENLKYELQKMYR
jgi:hypothetical protein